MGWGIGGGVQERQSRVARRQLGGGTWLDALGVMGCCDTSVSLTRCPPAAAGTLHRRAAHHKELLNTVEEKVRACVCVYMCTCMCYMCVAGRSCAVRGEGVVGR